MSAHEVPISPHGSRRFSTVLYDRHGTVVTDTTMVRGDLRFDIADIRVLGKTTGGLHPGVWAALAVAAGEVVVVGVAATATGSALAWVVAVVALAVPCGVAVHYAVRWPRELRLLADYRGTRVVLLCTRDRVEFGQVARAVQRAVEMQRQWDQR